MATSYSLLAVVYYTYMATSYSLLAVVYLHGNIPFLVGCRLIIISDLHGNILIIISDLHGNILIIISDLHGNILFLVGLCGEPLNQSVQIFTTTSGTVQVNSIAFKDNLPSC